jgi:hypothetical protein
MIVLKKQQLHCYCYAQQEHLSRRSSRRRRRRNERIFESSSSSSTRVVHTVRRELQIFEFFFKGTKRGRLYLGFYIT